MGRLARLGGLWLQQHDAENVTEGGAEDGAETRLDEGADRDAKS